MGVGSERVVPDLFSESLPVSTEFLVFEKAPNVFMLVIKPVFTTTHVLRHFNPLSPGVKLQFLLLCFHGFLSEIVGRSC